jgi:hypothetical protein
VRTARGRHKPGYENVSSSSTPNEFAARTNATSFTAGLRATVDQPL